MVRMTGLRLLVASFFMGLCSVSPATAGELTSTQVFPNVFTVAPQGPTGPNSTFIVTDEGVVVIDSGGSPEDARRILMEIRQHTIRPVRYVINTHYYGTHVFGNSVFRKEGAVIISSRKVQEAIAGKQGQQELKRLQDAGVSGLDLATVFPPNMAFEKRMDFIFGGVRLQIIPHGCGLTRGDTVVVLPDLSALITGGMVSNGTLPHMEESCIGEWADSVARLENYNAEIVIPGTGPVGERPVTIQMRHYLLDLAQQVKAAMDEGKSLEETVKTVRAFIDGKYPDWKGRGELDDNIRRTYHELQSANLSGKPGKPM